ncbi:MAG: O-antigen ligase family protein [Kofleriaceae bacterium]|nr:O-antigen ligase family protein [Kofleriaceae bacterium]
MFAALRRVLLVATGLSLPIEYVALAESGAYVLSPTKIVAAVFTAFSIGAWLAGSRPAPRAGKHWWVFAFAWSFAVSCGVTVLWGVPVSVILPFILTIASLLLFYVALTVGITSESELDHFLGGFIVGCVGVSFTALLGYGFVTESAEGERLGGLGGNVNELGFNLGVMLPVAFAYLIVSGSRIVRAAALGAVVVGVVATTNTLSRTAYLGALVMWVYGMFRFRRLDLLRYAIPGIALFVIGLQFMPDSAKERMLSMTGSRIRYDTSSGHRVVLNEWGLRAFASNPLVGVGVQNFGTWAGKQTPLLHPGSVIHNAFIRVGAEQGLVGLVPFVAILVAAWREFGRASALATRGGVALRSLRLKALLLQVALLGTFVQHLAQTSFNYKLTWALPALSTVVLHLVVQRVRSASRTTSGPIGVSQPERLARSTSA